ncbi:MAG: hypothetical protein ACRCU2_21445 [Planktothrix sp.]
MKILKFFLALCLLLSFIVLPVNALPISSSTQPLFLMSQPQQVLNAIKSLEYEGKNMNRNNLEECGNQMRKNKSIVEKLERQTDAWTDLGLKMQIGSILPTLEECVSCKPNATKYCKMVDGFVKEAEDYL